MIKSIFSGIRQTRQVFASLVDSLNTEQLNLIPEGFNNNIAWNFGHIVVTTPALCYQRSGVKPEYPVPLQAAYRKDSRPTYSIPSSEIIFLKELLVQSIDQIENDYKAGTFENGFVPFSTSTYGATLATIEEVLITTLMHDNLHLGYAQAQRRLLLAQQ